MFLSCSKCPGPPASQPPPSDGCPCSLQLLPPPAMLGPSPGFSCFGDLALAVLLPGRLFIWLTSHPLGSSSSDSSERWLQRDSPASPLSSPIPSLAPERFVSEFTPYLILSPSRLPAPQGYGLCLLLPTAVRPALSTGPARRK